MDSGVLDEVGLTHVQLINETTSAEKAAGKPQKMRFAFTGNLRFKALPGFDLFSFGSDPDSHETGQLNFENLSINMSYPQNDPSIKSFRFDAGHLAYNIPGSSARTSSLYRHFPLKLTGFLQAKSGTTPKSLGYSDIAAPLGGNGSLRYPWYALMFDLKLGTLGSLAGDADFVIKLIAAWSPGKEANAYVGLHIPGTGNSNFSFHIEGLLKIAVANYQFLIQENDGKTSYTLLMNNIGLYFMGKKLPPGGYVDLVIFGNPNQQAGSSSLGWYLAYAKDQPPSAAKSGTSQGGMI